MWTRPPLLRITVHSANWCKISRMGSGRIMREPMYLPGWNQPRLRIIELTLAIRDHFSPRLLFIYALGETTTAPPASVGLARLKVERVYGRKSVQSDEREGERGRDGSRETILMNPRNPLHYKISNRKAADYTPGKSR